MYKDVRYNNNYLEEVICRLDFASPILELRTSMPKPIFDVVKEFYPIAEPQDIIGTELSINPMSGPTVNQIISKQWVFLSRNRLNRCTIESESIIFSVRDYSVFESLREAIIQILKTLLNMYQDNQGKRFGLRYVNNLPIKGHNAWIEDKFIGALSAHKDAQTIKLLTTLEYAVFEKDLSVRLIYGYNNPDYPAVMKKEDFVIDIDAYTTGIIYKDDIEEFVDNMHSEVQNCFEKMITDEYRGDINKGDVHGAE